MRTRLYITKPLPFGQAAETTRTTATISRRRTMAGTPPPIRKGRKDGMDLQLAMDMEATSAVVDTDVLDTSDEDDISTDTDEPAPTPAPVKPGPRTPPPASAVAPPPEPETSDVRTVSSSSGSNPNFDAQAFRSQFDTQEPLNWSAFAVANAATPSFRDYADPWIPVQFGQPKYGRDYSAYDRAQKTEKAVFLKLLAELCRGITEPPQSMGRPRMSMADMTYSAVHKVYSLFSLRRHASDLQEARLLGYISRVPNFNTVCKYMQYPEMAHILMDLVTASAIPMKDLETQILFDSTGFSTSRFVKWFNKRWGKVTDNREWVKAHIVCGANTKIVTAVTLSGYEAHDTEFFEPLLNRTLEYFNPDSLAADKAYLSHKNIHLAMLAGVVPYIPFKSNTRIPGDNDDSAWANMYHYFRFNREDFYRHYHQRSNVETAVHMIKSKFGDAVRSKNDIAQVNEVLAKVLCHNIVEVHKASVMMGLDPVMDAVLPEQRPVPWHR